MMNDDIQVMVTISLEFEQMVVIIVAHNDLGYVLL